MEQPEEAEEIGLSLTDKEIWANLDADRGVIHFSEDATSLPTGWLGQ